MYTSSPSLWTRSTFRTGQFCRYWHRIPIIFVHVYCSMSIVSFLFYNLMIYSNMYVITNLILADLEKWIEFITNYFLYLSYILLGKSATGKSEIVAILSWVLWLLGRIFVGNGIYILSIFCERALSFLRPYKCFIYLHKVAYLFRNVMH